MAKLCAAIAAAALAVAPAIALAQATTGASVPTIPAQSPAAHDPGVNPSAAGIQEGDVGSAGLPLTKDERKHSGSKNLTANDHPYTAAKGNHTMRWRQRVQRELQRATGNTGGTWQNREHNSAGR
jgi:hypothetical protein